LPRKAGEKTKTLTALGDETRSLIFYESPHRTAATLQAMAEAFGSNRPAAVCREMTKLHEEVARGSLTELVDWAESKTLKGEIVIVVGPAPEDTPVSFSTAVEQVHVLQRSGKRVKAATRQVAQATGDSARDLYHAALATREHESAVQVYHRFIVNAVTAGCRRLPREACRNLGSSRHGRHHSQGHMLLVPCVRKQGCH